MKLKRKRRAAVGNLEEIRFRRYLRGLEIKRLNSMIERKAGSMSFTTCFRLRPQAGGAILMRIREIQVMIVQKR
jgi:hypothetical protein